MSYTDLREEVVARNIAKMEERLGGKVYFRNSRLHQPPKPETYPVAICIVWNGYTRKHVIDDEAQYWAMMFWNFTATPAYDQTAGGIKQHEA